MDFFKYASFAYMGCMLNKYAGNIPNLKSPVMATSGLTLNLIKYFDGRAEIIKKAKRTYGLKPTSKSIIGDLENKISNHKFEYTSKNTVFEGTHGIKIPYSFSLYMRMLLNYYSK
ncbi:MAG: hypothetical protein ACP5N2_01535 [Candidatus Nanoarchaeia archaeon]